MFRFNKNEIVIKDRKYVFPFDIREVLIYQDCYIVLLSIPFNSNFVNNIYCLDDMAQIVWQSEDILQKYPDLKNPLPYEQMILDKNKLYASDFFGRNFYIDTKTGKILLYNIGK